MSKNWSIPYMKDPPRGVLKRLNHIVPLTPISEGGERDTPRRSPPQQRKQKVNILNVKPEPQTAGNSQRPPPADYDYDYVHHAPYHDQLPMPHLPDWSHKDVNEVVNRYLIASQFGPPPQALSGPKLCPCCQTINEISQKKKKPHLNVHLEPLIQESGLVQTRVAPTTEGLPGHWRSESPELISDTYHLPVEDSPQVANYRTTYLNPHPGDTVLPPNDKAEEPLFNVIPLSDKARPVRPAAPSPRHPPPGRTSPPLFDTGGLFEPDKPGERGDYQRLHLTHNKRGEVLAAGGFDEKYMEHTQRGEITDNVVEASTKYHRAMEKLNRHINGLKIPNEPTMAGLS